jgi:uncharacterized GH25 family protein
MRTRKVIILILLVTFVSPLLAHEFWLQPERFLYQPGDKINVRFWVGEDFNGVNWSGSREKVNSLHLYFDGIKDDLSNRISDQKGDSLQLGIYDRGTAMIAFNSTNSFIRLEPEKFNEYLKEDGLDSAFAYRQAHGELDSAGTEHYQRSVKTLVQVGDKFTKVTMPTDLPLDLVPSKNPYQLKNGDSLYVQVLFNRLPLANHKVNSWQRLNGKTKRQEFISNSNGLIGFVVQRSGKWMVSAVHMQRNNDDPGCRWQSYWGSCTWGYE